METRCAVSLWVAFALSGVALRAHAEDAYAIHPPAIAYAPPRVPGYQVDLSVPTGYALRDASLVFDDTSGLADTERALVTDARPSAGVALTHPHPNIARLTFDLPFWKPGLNRFSVHGYAARGQARRAVESPMFQLTYELPRALGLGAAGTLHLPEKDFVRTMHDCRGVTCKDRDGDGLNDLWENVALQVLRPRLQLDRGDELFARKADVVSVMTSVKPLQRDGRPYVLFASVVAFSRDYGHFIGWAHPGDTEAFAMLFQVQPDGAIRWVKSAAKGHGCLTCKPTFSWYPQEFAEDGTPLLYVEQDKHGLWQNGRACREKSAFSCRGDRSLRPEAINVGDPSPEGPRMLVDALSGVDPDGPFAALFDVFRGDAVWTAKNARVKGRFCGGRSGCTRSSSANMPGTVLASLVRLFERAP